MAAGRICRWRSCASGRHGLLELADMCTARRLPRRRLRGLVVPTVLVRRWCMPALVRVSGSGLPRWLYCGRGQCLRGVGLPLSWYADGFCDSTCGCPDPDCQNAVDGGSTEGGGGMGGSTEIDGGIGTGGAGGAGGTGGSAPACATCAWGETFESNSGGFTVSGVLTTWAWACPRAAPGPMTILPKRGAQRGQRLGNQPFGKLPRE